MEFQFVKNKGVSDLETRLDYSPFEKLFLFSFVNRKASLIFFERLLDFSHQLSFKTNVQENSNFHQLLAR